MKMESLLSSSQKYSHHEDDDKFLSRVFSLSIKRQSCPICLEIIHKHRAAVIAVCKHAYCLDCICKWSNLKRNCPLCNKHFDSWFYYSNSSSKRFLKEQLPPLCKGKMDVSLESRPIVHDTRRVIQRTREELHSGGWRSRPLPWRRSFGRPGSVPPHVIDERKLQWRASVYRKGLQAVPLSSRNCLDQNTSLNDSERERMLRRIEPWIRRELQAILGDPDPTIIVHVASSVLITILERKGIVNSDQTSVEDDLFGSLRQFLHDQTNMFLHELRCFAESSLTMEAYDSVVDYKQLD